MAQVAKLIVRLLGTPEILCGGVPLELQKHKARALVFYLAATRRVHTREPLATLFWGEPDAVSARHSLRSALYDLRHALHAVDAGEALLIDGGLVSLQLSMVMCDLLRYRTLLGEGAEATLSQAVALYCGSLLQGFTLADAPDFDRWQRSTNAELRAECACALERLIE